MKYTIIGAVGHAGHGATTLIYALTGTPAERLSGDSFLNMETSALKLPDGTMAGILDTQGDEEGAVSLLRSASGMDTALFVVAADAGWTAQAGARLAILQQFGLKGGVVALTKIDLTDRYQIEAAEQAVRARLQDTFLAKAAVVRVSSKTGKGLDALRRALLSAVSRSESRNVNLPFRLPVDSVSARTGTEVSVTGTLTAGTLRTGETVEIAPQMLQARVRGLLVYGQKQKQAEAGSRVTALLEGISAADFTVGAVIAPVGTFAPTGRFDAVLRLPPDAPNPLKDFAAVRIYTGTAEVLGQISLLDARETLEAGAEAYIQFRSDTEFACAADDRFVCCAEAPLPMRGGGIVLDAAPEPHTKNDCETGQILAAKQNGTPEDFLLTFLQKFPAGISRKEMPALAGISDPDVETGVNALIAQEKAEVIAFDRVILTAARIQWTTRAMAALAAYHRQFPLRAGMPKEELRAALGREIDARAFGSLMAQWQAEKTFRTEGSAVRRPDFAAQLGERQIALLERIETYYRQCGIETPRMEEVCHAVKAPPDAVNALLRAGVERGRFVRVAEDIYYDAQTLAEAQRRVREAVNQHGSLTVAAFRDSTQSSRRFALQALEYLDKIRFTLRSGDERTLNTGPDSSPAAAIPEKK